VELLDAMAPRGKYVPVSYPGEWIFRGQSNATWDLLPSAYRPDAWLRTHTGWEHPAPGWKNGQQILAEYQTMKIFFRMADLNGLPLPEDSQRLRTIMHVLPNTGFIWELIKGDQNWPPLQLLSLIGLAQHHGVPTRILDWSRDRLTGAYFAAVSQAKALKSKTPPASGTRIAVWAANYLELGTKSGSINFERLDRDVILPITAPGAGNANLYAQGGLFTHLYRHRRVDPDAPMDYSPQTQVLESMTKVVKFTLPVEEAPRLLRMVAEEGTSAANLFPGFDGIRKAMEERMYWDKPDPHY
jgi:hypothetical protein